MRHHLYFLIPFVWLAAAVSAAAAQWVQKKWARMAFVAALAPVYIFLNLKEAAALRKDLRTNDLEWQFLLQESSRWPQSCRVYYPFHDSRRGILKKYFRFLSHAEEAEGCVLVYRSPVQDIFPAEAQTQQIKFNSLAGNPYREIRFKHRFYTTWDSSAETKNPITVTAGFYYLRPDKKEQVRAYVLFEKGLSLFAQGRVKQALENFEKAVSIWPQDPRFFLSAAAVRMMGEEDGENGRELEYLNRSLELARRERNPDLEAEIYSTLAYFWQKRGRNDLAAGYIKKAP